MDRQKRRKLGNKWLRLRFLVLLLLSSLTKRIRKLYRKSGTKKYHLNNLLVYVNRKNFEVNKVKILQQDIKSRPAIIESYRRGKSGAKTLILQSR